MMDFARSVAHICSRRVQGVLANFAPRNQFVRIALRCSTFMHQTGSIIWEAQRPMIMVAWRARGAVDAGAVAAAAVAAAQ